MPALQKLWIDEVLRFGWAYGPGGDALLGKDLWLVSSTGGSAESYAADGYNGHPINAFLLPYAQTARICGMRFLPPLLLHGTHRASEAEVAQHAELFVSGLARHRTADPGTPQPEIPLDARPALYSRLKAPL